jgi:hypothetical protein
MGSTLDTVRAAYPDLAPVPPTDFVTRRHGGCPLRQRVAGTVSPERRSPESTRETIVADRQEAPAPRESVTEPAKLLRVIGMTQRVLDELRHDGFGDAARERVNTVYEDSLRELQDLLSDDLRRELDRFAAPLHTRDAPSEAELRLAEAQLAGWLEGLLQGLQASTLSEQAAAQVAPGRAGQAVEHQHPGQGGYR